MISYLPSGLKGLTGVLKNLSKKKTNYKVKALNLPKKKQYKIEESLTIDVPYGVLNEFKRDIFGTSEFYLDEFEIDLTPYLNEALDDEMILAREDFKNVVTRLLNSDVFKSFRHKIAGLVKDGEDANMNFAPIGKSLLNEPEATRQVAELIALVEKAYSRNLGDLQILTNAIATRKPLSSFPLFARVDNILGTQLSGRFLGYPFVYNSEINIDFTAEEKLIIQNEDLEARLKTNPEMKWENGAFYPTTPNGFPYNLSELLKQYIRGTKDDSTTGK